jgi:hypothetical protein
VHVEEGRWVVYHGVRLWDDDDERPTFACPEKGGDVSLPSSSRTKHVGCECTQRGAGVDLVLEEGYYRLFHELG